MPLVNAGTAAPDSGSILAISDEGKQKQACAAHFHGDGSAAPNVAKKMKRNVEGLIPIDIDRALASSRPATADDAGGGDDVTPRLRRRRRRLLLLEIKKRGVEVEEQMLALERRRLRWAADADACREEEEDAELEKMRVENGRMRAENGRLWRRLLRRRRERELGVRSKREEKGRDGAVAKEGEEKNVP